MQSPGSGLAPQALTDFDARLDPDSAAPLALGLSGGGDSLALLTLALDWARPRGRPVLALTVDHRLQPEAAAWTKRTGDQARRLGADWRGLAWTGPKPERGLPEAARRARHALLAEAAREAGACVLLLGHTANDVREGERMRDAGTPLGRLRAWAPSPVWPEGRDIFLLRPLLQTGRAELRARLQGLGLDWIDDPANADPRFARARARAELADAADAPPPGEPAPAAHLPALDLGFGVLGFRRDVFLAAPERDARTALGMALLCASGRETPPRGAALERLLGRLAAGGAFAAVLAGARLEAGPELVHIFREAGETERGGLASIRLEAGQRSIWDGRFEIETPDAGEIRPARGLAGRLDPACRLALKALPPAARAAAPVLIRDADPRPVLAHRSACVRDLVELRRTAACGVIAHEREIVGRSRGANGATSLC